MKEKKLKSVTLKSLVYSFIYLAFISVSVFAQSDDITIAGSTTILPLSEKWAKMFKEKTGVTVNVHGGGSTSGIKATKLGTADIGASSRDLSMKERGNLREVIIGRDALAIIINKSNPLTNLTLEEARRIYTGNIKNWKELGGLDKPIQVVNRESGSGTRELFVEIVMRIKLQDDTQKTIPMTLTSIVNNSNAEVKETVKLVSNAIGYVSVGYADDSVKILNVNSQKPTPEKIISGEYPLVRNLYYLVRLEQKEKVKKFLRYVLSKEGQELIVKEGFFPVLSLTN